MDAHRRPATAVRSASASSDLAAPSALQVLKQLSVRGSQEERRLAHEHLAVLAPHLAEGHEERFKGADSWSSFATEKFPSIVDAEAYMAARKELRIYGVKRLRAELGGFVDNDGLLTLGAEKPFFNKPPMNSP